MTPMRDPNLGVDIGLIQAIDPKQGVMWPVSMATAQMQGQENLWSPQAQKGDVS